MKFIIGKKIEMSRVWRDDEAVTVTKVTAGPCTVIQTKTKAKDGYDAVQVGYGTRAQKNIKKPQIGHMKGLGNFRFLREFRYDSGHNTGYAAEFAALKPGANLTVGIFSPGDKVEIEGVSKGKGFQGTVKRHGFHGHNTTHGTKDQVRMPGSIGAGEPQHVFKGMRMAGRMGDMAVTVKNLEIIEVNQKDNTLLISGALPGARNSLIMIKGSGELKLAEAAIEPEKEENAAAEPVQVAKTEEAALTTEVPVKPEEKKEENKVEPIAEVKASSADEKPAVPAATAEAKSEVKPAAAATPAQKEEPTEKPAEAKSEKAADQAPAEKKIEEAGDKKPAETAAKNDAVTPAKPIESFVDGYQKRFNDLPKAEKEKFSSPEITKAVSELEEKYKMDLVSVVARLAIKEVTGETLVKFLTEDYKLDAARAELIGTEIKEKIIKLVA